MRFHILWPVVAALGVVNLIGWLADRRVHNVETPVGVYPRGYDLTCRDLFGHAFPADSIRQRDLMISIGCANGKDTTKLAHVEP